MPGYPICEALITTKIYFYDDVDHLCSAAEVLNWLKLDREVAITKSSSYRLTHTSLNEVASILRAEDA